MFPFASSDAVNNTNQHANANSITDNALNYLNIQTPQQSAAAKVSMVQQTCLGPTNVMVPVVNTPHPASTHSIPMHRWSMPMPSVYPASYLPSVLPSINVSVGSVGSIVYNAPAATVFPPSQQRAVQQPAPVMYSSSHPLPPSVASSYINVSQGALSSLSSNSHIPKTARKQRGEWEETDIVIIDLPPLDMETKNVQSRDINGVVIPQLNGEKKYEWTGSTCSGYWKYDRSYLYDERMNYRCVKMVCSCAKPVARQTTASGPQIRILWNGASKEWILQRHKKSDGTYGHTGMVASDTPYFCASKGTGRALQLLCIPKSLCDSLTNDILPTLEFTQKRAQYVIKRLADHVTDKAVENPSLITAFESATKNMTAFSSDVKTIIKNQPTRSNYKTMFSNDDIKELIDDHDIAPWLAREGYVARDNYTDLEDFLKVLPLRNGERIFSFSQVMYQHTREDFVAIETLLGRHLKPDEVQQLNGSVVYTCPSDMFNLLMLSRLPDDKQLVMMDGTYKYGFKNEQFVMITLGGESVDFHGRKATSITRSFRPITHMTSASESIASCLFQLLATFRLQCMLFGSPPGYQEEKLRGMFPWAYFLSDFSSALRGAAAALSPMMKLYTDYNHFYLSMDSNKGWQADVPVPYRKRVRSLLSKVARAATDEMADMLMNHLLRILETDPSEEFVDADLSNFAARLHNTYGKESNCNMRWRKFIIAGLLNSTAAIEAYFKSLHGQPAALMVSMLPRRVGACQFLQMCVKDHLVHDALFCRSIGFNMSDSMHLAVRPVTEKLRAIAIMMDWQYDAVELYKIISETGSLIEVGFIELFGKKGKTVLRQTDAVVKGVELLTDESRRQFIVNGPHCIGDKITEESINSYFEAQCGLSSTRPMSSQDLVKLFHAGTRFCHVTSYDEGDTCMNKLVCVDDYCKYCTCQSFSTDLICAGTLLVHDYIIDEQNESNSRIDLHAPTSADRCRLVYGGKPKKQHSSKNTRFRDIEASLTKTSWLLSSQVDVNLGLTRIIKKCPYLVWLASRTCSQLKKICLATGKSVGRDAAGVKHLLCARLMEGTSLGERVSQLLDESQQEDEDTIAKPAWHIRHSSTWRQKRYGVREDVANKEEDSESATDSESDSDSESSLDELDDEEEQSEDSAGSPLLSSVSLTRKIYDWRDYPSQVMLDSQDNTPREFVAHRRSEYRMAFRQEGPDCAAISVALALSHLIGILAVSTERSSRFTDSIRFNVLVMGPQIAATTRLHDSEVHHESYSYLEVLDCIFVAQHYWRRWYAPPPDSLLSCEQTEEAFNQEVLDITNSATQIRQQLDKFFTESLSCIQNNNNNGRQTRRAWIFFYPGHYMSILEHWSSPNDDALYILINSVPNPGEPDAHFGVDYCTRVVFPHAVSLSEYIAMRILQPIYRFGSCHAAASSETMVSVYLQELKYERKAASWDPMKSFSGTIEACRRMGLPVQATYLKALCPASRRDENPADIEEYNDVPVTGQHEALRRLMQMKRGLSEGDQREISRATAVRTLTEAKQLIDYTKRGSANVINVIGWNSLRKGKLLQDEVINYLLLLCQDTAYQNNAAVFPTTFAQMLRRRKYSYGKSQRNFASALMRSGHKKTWTVLPLGVKSIFDMKLLFFPINVNSVHWIVVKVNVEQQLIEYFDSLPACGDIAWMDDIHQYLRDEHKDKLKRPLPSGWKKVVRTDLLQQGPDTMDCGVFAMMYMAFGISNLPCIFSQADLDGCRDMLCLSILRNRWMLWNDEYDSLQGKDTTSLVSDSLRTMITPVSKKRKATTQKQLMTETPKRPRIRGTQCHTSSSNRGPKRSIQEYKQAEFEDESHTSETESCIVESPKTQLQDPPTAVKRRVTSRKKAATSQETATLIKCKAHTTPLRQTVKTEKRTETARKKKAQLVKTVEVEYIDQAIIDKMLSKRTKHARVRPTLYDVDVKGDDAKIEVLNRLLAFLCGHFTIPTGASGGLVAHAKGLIAALQFYGAYDSYLHVMERPYLQNGFVAWLKKFGFCKGSLAKLNEVCEREGSYFSTWINAFYDRNTGQFEECYLYVCDEFFGSEVRALCEKYASSDSEDDEYSK